MKKLSIYLLLILCLFITGCGEEKLKTVATLDQFSNIASSKGFEVTDNIVSYNGVEYILEAKRALYDGIEIEMIKYSDNESADKVQQGHIENFDLLKSTGAHAIKDKGSNYYSYALVSNNRYMISARVENTLIFCKVMVEDKELVDEIINELGY